MKILYITDIHGVEWKYEKIFQIAKSSKVKTVINGGDMLPLKPSFLKQDQFIINFLDDLFLNFNSEEIFFICMLGNDDLIIFDELFEKTCTKYKFAINIAQRYIIIQDYEFIGMNWVTDLPFGLKDRCRMDSKDFIFPKQIGKQVLSTPNGLKKIEDWYSYAKTLPTMEDELNNLVKPVNLGKTIYIIHDPPANVSLDVCNDGKKVGSKAVYGFLKTNQPLLSLHGHIHESPHVSGKWNSKIGNTTCIQPGQSSYYENYMIYVIIDLKSMKYSRFRREKD